MNGESDGFDTESSLDNEDDSPVDAKERIGETSFFSPTRRFSDLGKDTSVPLVQHFYGDGKNDVVEEKRPFSMPTNMFGTNDVQTPFTYEDAIQKKRETENSPIRRPPLNRSTSASVVQSHLQIRQPIVNMSPQHTFQSLETRFEQERNPFNHTYPVPQQAMTTPIRPVSRPALLRAHSSPSGCNIQQPNLHQIATMNVHNSFMHGDVISTGGSTPMSLCSLSPRDSANTSPSTPNGTSPHGSLLRPSFKRSVSHSSVYTDVKPKSNYLMDVDESGNHLQIEQPPPLVISPKSHTYELTSPTGNSYVPPPMRKAYSTNTVLSSDKHLGLSRLNNIESHLSPTNIGHEGSIDYNTFRLRKQKSPTEKSNMLPSLNQLFGNNFVQQTRPYIN
jgi:hypothetical protein